MNTRRQFLRGVGVAGGVVVFGSAVGEAAASDTSGAEGSTPAVGTVGPAPVSAQIFDGAAPADVASAADVSVDVTAQRFDYTPSTISVHRGDRVLVNLQSIDVTHGWELDGYGINVKGIDLSSPKSVVFTAAYPGSFRFRCSYTCGSFHPFMIGRLVVHNNVRFDASLAGSGLVGAAVIGGLKRRAGRADASTAAAEAPAAGAPLDDETDAEPASMEDDV